MIRKAKYKCPTCGATAEIVDDLLKNGNDKHQDFPDKVVCGFHGCTDYRRRIDNG